LPSDQKVVNKEEEYPLDCEEELKKMSLLFPSPDPEGKGADNRESEKRKMVIK